MTAQLLLAVELLVSPASSHPAWRVRSCGNQGAKLCQALVPMYLTAILSSSLRAGSSGAAAQLFTFQLACACLAPIACRCIRPGAYRDMGTFSKWLTVLGDVSAASVVALTLHPILWHVAPVFVVLAALLVAFTTAAAHHVTLINFPWTFTEGEAWLVVSATVNSLMWLAFSWTSRVAVPISLTHLAAATLQMVEQLDTLPIVVTLTTVLFCCAVSPSIHDLVDSSSSQTEGCNGSQDDPPAHNTRLRQRAGAAGPSSDAASLRESSAYNATSPSHVSAAPGGKSSPRSSVPNGHHKGNGKAPRGSARSVECDAHALHQPGLKAKARSLARLMLLTSAYACVMAVCACYTLQYVFSKTYRVATVLAWAAAVGFGVPGMMLVASWELVPHVVLRKGFHILTLAMFIPVLIVDPPLLAVALAVAFVLMSLCELVRTAEVPVVSGLLSHVVEKFTDSRDEGVFLVSHMSLLMGIAVPLWISVADATGSRGEQQFQLESMPAWSGLVALGISDTAAAVVGTVCGRVKVHRSSSKSVEGLLTGTFAMVASLAAVAVCASVQRDWEWWYRLLWYSLLTCTLEAVTLQLDNCVFPWHACTMMTLLS